MMMKFVFTASVDNQRAFGFASLTCFTCLTRVVSMPLTKGAEFTRVIYLVWVVAIGSLMSATSQHIPGPMPCDTSGQVTVAFVPFSRSWESNRLAEATCNSLFELAKGCCQREWYTVVEQGNSFGVCRCVSNFGGDDANRNGRGDFFRLFISKKNGKNDTICASIR